MDERANAGRLFGDLSAVTLGNRDATSPRCWTRTDWHPRLLNGSDYPLPGVLPLVALDRLAARGMLAADAIPVLREIRDHNAILFDFVLKRRCAVRRARRFPAAVFTRRHFSAGRVMHAPNQFDLLRQRRFAPFFWTQFAGGRRQRPQERAGDLRRVPGGGDVVGGREHARQPGRRDLHPAVHAVSATAGQLADKYEKSRLIRLVKLFEIAIMVVAAYGFWRRDLVVLFTALALMGVHSTLFGPVKYAILPQHLKVEELIGGNGLVGMGTFIAILLGTIAGGLVVAIRRTGRCSPGRSAWSWRSPAILGRGIPTTPAVDPTLTINWNPLTETLRNPRHRAREPRRLAVDARHLVVLVLRRDVPRAVSRLRARLPRR